MGLFAGNNGGGEKRGRGRPKKDPFANLSEDFKDGVAAMSPEEIHVKISEVARAEVENRIAFKDDQHLAELREEVKEASAGYKEVSAANDAKIKFLKRVLEDKGAA